MQTLCAQTSDELFDNDNGTLKGNVSCGITGVNKYLRVLAIYDIQGKRIGGILAFRTHELDPQISRRASPYEVQCQ